LIARTHCNSAKASLTTRQILLDTLVAHLLASSRGKRLREIHRQNSFSETGKVIVRAGSGSLFGGGFLSLAEF
jgi:hypothetical protein